MVMIVAAFRSASTLGRSTNRLHRFSLLFDD